MTSSKDYRITTRHTNSSSALATIVAFGALALNKRVHSAAPATPPAPPCTGNFTQPPLSPANLPLPYSSIFPNYSLIALTFLFPEVVFHLHALGNSLGEAGSKLSEQLFHGLFTFLALGQIGLLLYLAIAKPSESTQTLDFLFIGLAAFTSGLEIIISHVASWSKRPKHIELKFQEERNKAMEECKGHQISIYRLAFSRLRESLPHFRLFSQSATVTYENHPNPSFPSATRGIPSPEDIHNFRILFMHAFMSPPQNIYPSGEGLRTREGLFLGAQRNTRQYRMWPLNSTPERPRGPNPALPWMNV